MGKTHLEVAIHDEARALVEHLKSFKGKPTEYPQGLRTAVLNVVWQLVVSKRYDLTSYEEVDKVFNVIECFRNESSAAVFAEVSFPILKSLPKFLADPILKPHVLANFRKEMTATANVRTYSNIHKLSTLGIQEFICRDILY